MNVCLYVYFYKMMNLKENLPKAAYLLKAIAHETRLCVILQLMQTKEKTVSQLMEDAQCGQSLLSHHLTDMRAKGILDCRKDGKNCYYSLKNKGIGVVISQIIEENNE